MPVNSETVMVTKRPEDGTDFRVYATGDGRVLVTFVGADPDRDASMDLSPAEAMLVAESLALGAGAARRIIEGN